MLQPHNSFGSVGCERSSAFLKQRRRDPRHDGLQRPALGHLARSVRHTHGLTRLRERRCRGAHRCFERCRARVVLLVAVVPPGEVGNRGLGAKLPWFEKLNGADDDEDEDDSPAPEEAGVSILISAGLFSLLEEVTVGSTSTGAGVPLRSAAYPRGLRFVSAEAGPTSTQRQSCW